MKAQHLKNAILQLAIQGKLVPQDPNDEPAQILLEKIQQEKQKLIAEGKIKKSKKTSEKSPYANQAEIPFEIPESWVSVRLENIGEIIGGGTPKTNEINNWNGHIPWVTPADMKYISGKYIRKGTRNITSKGLHSSSARILTKSSIIYSSRAPIGYIAITLNELATNQGFKSIDLYQEEVVDYIYYALIYFTPEIQARASGTTFKEISGSEFGKTIIPLPPLAEQKRIVAKIEELLPLVEQYDQKEQALTTLHHTFPIQLKKSILQAAIQGKLVEQNPQDEPANHLIERIQAEKARLISEKKCKKPKKQTSIIRRDNSHYELVDGIEHCIDEELPFDIPESWCWVRLESVILKNIGGGTPNKNEHDYWNGVIPWASVKDLDKENMFLDCTLDHISELGLEKSSSNLIPKNNILVCTRMGLGKISINRIDVAINQDLRGIILSEYVSKLYFVYFFKTLNLQGQGLTVKGLPLNELNNLYFPLPPLAEQKRIVEKIEKLFSYLKKLEKN